MYLGKCKINQEAIEKFVLLGRELEINGIPATGAQESPADENEDDLDEVKNLLKLPVKEEIINIDPMCGSTEEEEESVDWWSISKADTHTTIEKERIP